MKSSLTFTFDPGSVQVTATSSSAKRSATLGTLADGASARVAAVCSPADEADWLRALGLFEGQTVTVLRRALFGGPLHVRTGSGGEFAVDRSLAAQIEVVPDEA